MRFKTVRREVRELSEKRFEKKSEKLLLWCRDPKFRIVIDWLLVNTVVKKIAGQPILLYLIFMKKYNIIKILLIYF